MSKRLLACFAASAALAAGAGAADDPTRRGFDPDPARLALSLEGGFAVETAQPAAPGTYRLGAVLDLADGLLALSLGSRRDDLLESRLSLHLLGGWSFGRIELAAHLPIALWQRSDLSLLTDQGVTGPLVDPVAATALGDLRLGAKVAILDAARWPVGLAALLDWRLPTGSREAFTSDGHALVPSVVATRSLGKVRVDAQLGYVIRGQGQYAQLVVHDGFTYGLGGSLDLPPLGRLERWKAIAELTGGWPRGYDLGGERYRAPLSARAGVRAFLSQHVSVELGGGAGLGEAGYGRERWRVFTGVRWSGQAAGRPDADADGDGVRNEKDLCPTTPGKAELDGCPDDDDDGIPNPEDRCRKEPGPAENDGCPLEPGEPLVELETERLSLKDSIHFDTGKDTLKRESFPILDQVSKLIADHPELKRIRVEGHTDNVGGAAYNKDLSERRASSVVRYLVAKGVAQQRLASAGYGFEKPVTSNATALGRAKNRRVEFTILESGAP
jgi:outer membrane protein OmpA-like peptidoglycan-associated protein